PGAGATSAWPGRRRSGAPRRAGARERLQEAIPADLRGPFQGLSIDGVLQRQGAEGIQGGGACQQLIEHGAEQEQVSLPRKVVAAAGADDFAAMYRHAAHDAPCRLYVDTFDRLNYAAGLGMSLPPGLA